MERLIIILILLLSFSLQVNAQKALNFKYYEDTTLNLYREEAWKPLIRMGKEALQVGIDYYYLRMRIGIAYHELERYRQSIPHFNKALTLNSGSAEAAEYLYYALEYAGHFQERNLLYYKHKKLLKDQVNFEDNELIDYFHVNGGWKLSKGVREIGSQSFFQLGMGHQLFGGRLHLYHAYQQWTQGYNYIDTIRRGPRFFERWNSFNYTQYEYYFNPTLQFRKGFAISPATHWQWVDLITDTQTNYVWSLSISKAWAFWQLELHGSYSFINEHYQRQGGLSLTFYPLGNNNLYLGTEGNLVFHDENPQQVPIIKGKLGFRFLPQTWLEGMASKGEIYNYQEGNGEVVFNSPDKISSRWGLRGIHHTSKGHRFILSYMLENKTSEFYNGNYINHAIIGDILINF